MKYLLISVNERHAFLLEILAAEGHEVKLLCKNDTGAWKGLVPRAKNLDEVRAWGPDIIVIDSPGFGPLAHRLQGEGFKVFGGSKLQDKMAENKLFGMSILETCDVDTLEYCKFDNVADAADYVQGKNRPWVMCLPDGSVRQAKNDIDLQLQMEDMNEAKTIPAEFAIQKGFPEFINASLMLRPQFYLCGLYNSTGLMDPCLRMDMAYNLLPDSQGVPTIEGCNLRAVGITEKDVCNTLKKLEKPLGVMNYQGFVYLGCTIDYDDDDDDDEEAEAEGGGRKVCVQDVQIAPPDGFWAAFARGLDMNLGLFFDRVLNPRRANTPFEWCKSGFICSRKLTLPPYPYTEAAWIPQTHRDILSRGGIPHTKFFRQKWGIYWNDVFQAEGDEGFLQACGPLLGYVVGRGDSYSDAVEDCRDAAASIAIPYAQLKVDDSIAEFNLAC